MVVDGSAWEYASPITDGTCQLCSETDGDSWVENIPYLQGLVEYHTPPCANQPLVTWSATMIVKSVTPLSATVPATPVAVTITNGVVAQGGDGTTTISGICPAGAYCGITYWIPGETGIQHKLVIKADTATTISGFRGTLSSWDHQPSALEVGLDAGNLAATYADATTAGITFSGNFVEQK
jgi:hypothetical protein